MASLLSRRIGFAVLAFAALIAARGFFPSPSASAQTGGIAITSGPTATAVADTMATIQWTTSVAGVGRVYYGETAALGSSWSKLEGIGPEESEVSESSHVMRLEELKPGTTYFYKVWSKNAAGAEVESGQSSFVTAAASVRSLDAVVLSAPATGARLKSPVVFRVRVSGAASSVAFSYGRTGAATARCDANKDNDSGAEQNWSCGPVTLEAGEYAVSAVAAGTDAAGSSTTRTTVSLTFVVEPTCTEDAWECGEWGSCLATAAGFAQGRTCTRKTDCPGVETPSPATSQSCTPPCTADVWECGAWSACADGTRTRSCEMKTDCPAVVTPRPATSEACVEAPPACRADEYECRTSQCRYYEGEGWLKKQECRMTNDCPGVDTAAPELRHEPCCVDAPEGDKWVCGEWGACEDGVQRRDCVLRPDCPDVDVPSPESARSCEDESPSGIGIATDGPSVNGSVDASADASSADEPADPLDGASDELRALAGGVGAAMDAYEREADAAADRTADAQDEEDPESKECRLAGINPERCRAWLVAKYADASCRRAGIYTVTECDAFLREKNGGTFPGCEGASPEQCDEVRRRALVGYFDQDLKGQVDALIALGSKEGIVVPIPGVTAVDARGADGAAWFPSADVEGQDGASAVVIRDVDRDGLPDDLERSRGTNPNDSDSDDDGMPDGEELKNGTDPLGTDGVTRPLSPVERVIVNRLPLQQPRGDAGAVDPDFSVQLSFLPETDDEVIVAAGESTTDVPRDVNEPYPPERADGVAKPPDSEVLSCRDSSQCPPEYPFCLNGTCYGDGKDVNGPLQPSTRSSVPDSGRPTGESNVMTFTGKASPGTTVAVFIYSYVPMVMTATTDADGNFTVQIEGDVLAEGEHEMYVAVTDDTGKIEKKSNPLAFFVKEAQAVSEEDFLQPDVTAAAIAPERKWQGAYLMGTVVAVVLALAAAWLLFGKKLGETPPPPQPQA